MKVSSHLLFLFPEMAISPPLKGSFYNFKVYVGSDKINDQGNSSGIRETILNNKDHTRMLDRTQTKPSKNIKKPVYTP